MIAVLRSVCKDKESNTHLFLQNDGYVMYGRDIRNYVMIIVD